MFVCALVCGQPGYMGKQGMKMKRKCLFLRERGGDGGREGGGGVEMTGESKIGARREGERVLGRRESALD